jgi:hypothetical protein
VLLFLLGAPLHGRSSRLPDLFQQEKERAVCLRVLLMRVSAAWSELHKGKSRRDALGWERERLSKGRRRGRHERAQQSATHLLSVSTRAHPPFAFCCSASAGSLAAAHVESGTKQHFLQVTAPACGRQRHPRRVLRPASSRTHVRMRIVSSLLLCPPSSSLSCANQSDLVTSRGGRNSQGMGHGTGNDAASPNLLTSSCAGDSLCLLRCPSFSGRWTHGPWGTVPCPLRRRRVRRSASRARQARAERRATERRKRRHRKTRVGL